MTSTVPTPETPGQPGEKRADQLEEHDWIAWNDGFGTDLVEVLGTHARAGDTLIALAAPQGGPFAVTVPDNHMVRLAGAPDIEAAKMAGLRAQIAADLRRLGDLITANEVLIPHAISDVRGIGDPVKLATHLDSLDELAAVSKVLDIDVEVDSAGRHSVFWPQGHKGFQPGLHCEWFLYVEKDEPTPTAADTGMDYSREPDAPTAAPVPAGVDGFSPSVRPVSGAGQL